MVADVGDKTDYELCDYKYDGFLQDTPLADTAEMDRFVLFAGCCLSLRWYLWLRAWLLQEVGHLFTRT